MELGANPELKKKLQKEKGRLWREEVSQKEAKKNQKITQEQYEEQGKNYIQKEGSPAYKEMKERIEGEGKRKFSPKLESDRLIEKKKVKQEVTNLIRKMAEAAETNKDKQVWSETSLLKQLELLKNKVEQFKDKPEIRQAYENKIAELQKNINESGEDTGGAVIIEKSVEELGMVANGKAKIIPKKESTTNKFMEKVIINQQEELKRKINNLIKERSQFVELLEPLKDEDGLPIKKQYETKIAQTESRIKSLENQREEMVLEEKNRSEKEYSPLEDLEKRLATLTQEMIGTRGEERRLLLKEKKDLEQEIQDLKEGEKKSFDLKKGDRFVTPNEEILTLVDYDKAKEIATFVTRFGKKEFTKAELLTLINSKEFMTEEEARKHEHLKMAKIAELLKKGVDRVVVHGQEKLQKDPEGNESMNLLPAIDFDTQAALYLLKLSKIKYNDGAHTEIVFKGEKTSGIDPNSGGQQEELGTVLHIDTSGERLSFEITENGKTNMIYVDHHPKEGHTRTSATKLMGRILEKRELLEGDKTTEALIKFATEIDNLTYVDKKDFNKDFFKNKWPGSLYALYEELPFNTVIELLEKGRDPLTPFTEEEMGAEKFNGLSLKEIIENKKRGASGDIARIETALYRMKRQGIKTHTEELGGVIYNTLDRQKDVPEQGINPINKMANAFEATKAFGGDTFISYNEKTKKFFINSTTKDLRPVFDRLQKVIPGAKFIRGVMILPPFLSTERQGIDRRKFLEICGLVDDKTKLYEETNFEPQPVSNPDEDTNKKEEARIALEKQIEDVNKNIEKLQGEINELDTGIKEDDRRIAEIRERLGAIAKERGNLKEGNLEIKNFDKTFEFEKGLQVKIKIEKEKIKDLLVPIDGRLLFKGMQGRWFALAKVGDTTLPFYVSSEGTSGKNQGEWYPFFGGSAAKGWIIKGGVEEMNKGYGIKEIKEVQKALNEGLQLPQNYLDLFGQMQTTDHKKIFDIKDHISYGSYALGQNWTEGDEDLEKKLDLKHAELTKEETDNLDKQYKIGTKEFSSAYRRALFSKAFTSWKEKFDGKKKEDIKVKKENKDAKSEIVSVEEAKEEIREALKDILSTAGVDLKTLRIRPVKDNTYMMSISGTAKGENIRLYYELVNENGLKVRASSIQAEKSTGDKVQSAMSNFVEKVYEKFGKGKEVNKIELQNNGFMIQFK